MLILATSFAYKFYSDNEETTRRYEELVGKTSDYNQITDALAKLRTDYADQKRLQEKLIEEWGDLPEPEQSRHPHWDLAKSCDIIDFELDKNQRKGPGDLLALFNSADYIELAIYKSDPNTVGSASSLLGLDYRDTVTINFK